MVDKESSDELGTLASDMMRKDAGLSNADLDEIARKISATNPVTVAEWRIAARPALEPYLAKVRRLAASVVSQSVKD